MATRTAINREIRGFAVIWTFITVVIGLATFFAIYLTYDGTSGSAGDNNVGLPVVPPESQSQNAAALATAVPTQFVIEEPTDTPAVAEAEPAAETQNQGGEGVSVAQAQDSQMSQEQPAAQPTILPIDDEAYAVGIQVQFSISFDPEIQRMWMNDVQDLGLNWIKQQVRWEDFEPVQSEYDWRILDLVLPIAAERGIKVLVSVVTTPEWARQPGADLELGGPPANNQDFVNFVVAMLRRYPGAIHAIEVWNEQNIDREWGSTNGVSAPDYVALLRDTYQAVKAVDPGVIVVSGALSPTGGLVTDGVVRAIDDFDYMDQLINAGLLNYTDCVGAHHNGYNISPSVTWDAVPDDPDAVFRGPFDNPHHSWSFRSTLQTYATKIAVAGGDQRLCVTEFGWPTVEDLDGYPQNFEFALDNTLQEQADWTVEAINNMDEWSIVWLAFIWNLNYGPQAGWDTSSDNTPYSLIGPEWSRRPAYDAIKAWSASRQS